MVHPPSTGSRRIENALLLLIVIACAWFYSSRLREGDRWFTRQPDGYYPLLTAGFRAGHTYLPLAPHPALLALKDPYDPVANAPYRAHDMSLWHRKYYLYFGATPVLIFFWPVVAVTGWYPTELCAVALFSFAGFLAAVTLLRSIRRRYFPAASFWLLGAGALCVALGSPILSLTAEGRFYEVPGACAFLLQMLMFGAIYRALHSSRRALAWIAAASLFFGLSVGARPNYLFSGTALLIFLAWAIRRRPGASPGKHARVRAALAILGPAVACGFGLMVYNGVRFGSPLDFGVQHALTGADNRNLPLFYLGHVIPQGFEYLFGPGSWQRYFPFFIAPPTKPYGLLRYFPWCWLAPLAFVPWSDNGGQPNRERSVLVAAIGVAFLSNLIPLLCFFGTVDRYMADFVPASLLLGGIGALALGAFLARTQRRLRLALLPVAGAAAYSIFVELCVFATLSPHPERMLSLGRLADRPAQLWERAHGTQYGALQLELELPAGQVGRTEPIFETGPAISRRDSLRLTYLAGGRAQLAFFHAGLGVLEGKPFPIPQDRRISIVARCGSLLPPYEHPIFADWTRRDYETLSRDLLISVNGGEVLHLALACYPSAPENLRIGVRGWYSDGVADRFSGRILSVRRLPLGHPVPAAAILHRRTPIELSVSFPVDRSAGWEPIAATGSGQQSDLVYCIYEDAGHLRFAFDHSDSGGPQGESIACEAARPHLLKIWIGSLAEPEPAASGRSLVPPDRRVVVLMDGAVALNEEANFNPTAPESIVIGTNPFRSTTIARRFSGLILAVGQAGDLAALPSLRSTGEYGAVSMKVVFPEGVLGTAEPLVVTGATGAGDLLYVKYEDPTHVRFAFDHWGVGGLDGLPVETDLGEPHQLEISMGSLYPPGTAGAWLQHVLVKLDGVTVLDGVSACHPSWPDQIQIGRNPIGGSTCGPAFTGRILSLRRPPKPAE